ncbi:HYC_CC_PP family protein [Jiulongibacter sediminis]|jgi:hypothetical protein|uniref:HYC_CC_PP family protein n=1 Tax=Jiulongibacter sediminis TaxID=1605367 RepID=UPI0026ED025B|nr:hypothetical protein [Jiulongibacter sediminis]
MKKQLLRIFSFAMALNIFFSSMGLAFYEHTCDVLQETTVNIGHDKDCCGEAFIIESDYEGTQLKQGECCHTDIELKKVDTNAGFALKKVDQKSVVYTNTTVDPIFSFVLVASEELSQSFLRPPPVPQRPLHLLYDVFLI